MPKIPPHIPFQTKCSLGVLIRILFRCLVQRYSTSLFAFSHLFHLFYRYNLSNPLGSASPSPLQKTFHQLFSDTLLSNYFIS